MLGLALIRIRSEQLALSFYCPRSDAETAHLPIHDGWRHADGAQKKHAYNNAICCHSGGSLVFILGNLFISQATT
jgi:hypothetical protein